MIQEKYNVVILLDYVETTTGGVPNDNWLLCVMSLLSAQTGYIFIITFTVNTQPHHILFFLLFLSLSPSSLSALHLLDKQCDVCCPFCSLFSISTIIAFILQNNEMVII